MQARKEGSRIQAAETLLPDFSLPGDPGAPDPAQSPPQLTEFLSIPYYFLYYYYYYYYYIIFLYLYLSIDLSIYLSPSITSQSIQVLYIFRHRQTRPNLIDFRLRVVYGQQQQQQSMMKVEGMLESAAADGISGSVGSPSVMIH